MAISSLGKTDINGFMKNGSNTFDGETIATIMLVNPSASDTIKPSPKPKTIDEIIAGINAIVMLTTGVFMVPKGVDINTMVIAIIIDRITKVFVVNSFFFLPSNIYILSLLPFLYY